MQWFFNHSHPSSPYKLPSVYKSSMQHNSKALCEVLWASFGMGKSRKNTNEKHGIRRLKVLVEKLRKSFSLHKSLNENDTGDEVCRAYEVPDDVKEGYFAVSVINGGTPKRFVVALGYLNHPEFLKLLDKAEEEFGFEQQGALAMPCLASDLQSILGESDDGEWESE